jgi:hypothetical protein
VSSSPLRVQKLEEHTISVLSTGCLKKRSQNKKFTHDNMLDIRAQIFNTTITLVILSSVYLSSVLQYRHHLQHSTYQNNTESPIMCINWTTKAVRFVFFTASRASMWPTQSMQWTMVVLSLQVKWQVACINA